VSTVHFCSRATTKIAESANPSFSKGLNAAGQQSFVASKIGKIADLGHYMGDGKQSSKASKKFYQQIIVARCAIGESPLTSRGTPSVIPQASPF
jgi:hypothetical protein